jgi:hypothetical protein
MSPPTISTPVFRPSFSGHAPHETVPAASAYNSLELLPSSGPDPTPLSSDIHNPNDQVALVSGVQPGMMHSFNSGHFAESPHSQGESPGPINPIQNRSFRCDQCSQSFSMMCDLERHMKNHLPVKLFPCAHCPFQSRRKDNLWVRSNVPFDLEHITHSTHSRLLGHTKV